jgi:hypothetical protein
MAGSRKGKWVKRSEGELGALLSRFAGSGLGVEAFCRREVGPPSVQVRWVWRFTPTLHLRTAQHHVLFWTRVKRFIRRRGPVTENGKERSQPWCACYGE